MSMFIVTLEVGGAGASELMAGHKAWIDRGFDDGVFLLVGSLRPAGGGAVLAHATTRDELAAFVASDPLVAEGVATAHIVEVAPARADARLGFLLG